MFCLDGMQICCLLVIAASVCAAQGKECDAVEESNVQFLQQSSFIEKVAQQHSVATDHASGALSNLTGGTKVAGVRGDLHTPNVVIVGFGDSGTRAIKNTFETLGLKFSPLQDKESGDNWLSTITDQFTPLLLTAGQGRISHKGYQQNQLLWTQALTAVEHSIWITFGGITTSLGLDIGNASLPWGLKSPGQMYLLPLYDALLKDSARYVFVARDPRDFCTADPGGHNATKKEMQWFGTYKSGTKGGTDCYGFWSSSMQDLFDLYENDSRFRILRTEDLVMPNPAVDDFSFHILNSLADFAGVPKPSREDALQWLTYMHSFNGSYQGHHFNLNDENRSEIEANFSKHVQEHPVERDLLDKLGYSLEKYGLEKPSCKNVFQPAV